MNDRLSKVTELTSAWLDGIATDEQKSQLNDLLQGDPEACEHYLDLVEMHTALAMQTEGEEMARRIEDLPAIPGGPNRQAVRRKHIIGPLALAAGLTILLFSILGFPGSSSDREPMTSGGGVAVISRLVGENRDFAEGDVLFPGRFAIADGYAQIEFFCGSTVILEGPAELDIRTMWLAICNSGRLRVSVPEPARGFTIKTADFSAVDLGTEFALSVSPEGRSEVHVIDGEVRLDDLQGQQITLLTGGMGVREGDSDDLENVPARAEGFVGRRELQSLASRTSENAFLHWQTAAQQRRDDKSLLLNFDFENQASWDRQISNHARSGSNAAIIGAQWTEGRWTGKKALEFGRVSDRVRLTIPGEYDELTLAASIHVRSFDRWLSSLILTDGFEPGELHWQISDKGELILGIGDAAPINTFSPPVITTDDLGSWLHVAVTVDRATRTVIHYLNGSEIVRETKKSLPPLRFGDAEIGNWQAKQTSHPMRSFNGRIDEFLIYSRVLSPDEISRLASGR